MPSLSLMEDIASLLPLDPDHALPDGFEFFLLQGVKQLMLFEDLSRVVYLIKGKFLAEYFYFFDHEVDNPGGLPPAVDS